MITKAKVKQVFSEMVKEFGYSYISVDNRNGRQGSIRCREYFLEKEAKILKG